MSKPYKLMEKIKHASQSIYTLAALGVVATISGIATYHSVEEKMPAIDKAWYEMHELTQQAKEPKSLTCIIDQFQEKPYTVQKTVNGIRSILQLDEEDKDSLKRYADQLDEYLPRQTAYNRKQNEIMTELLIPEGISALFIFSLFAKIARYSRAKKKTPSEG